MESDLSLVEKAVRVAFGRGKFQAGGEVFSESLWYVDESFLEIFSFPLRHGHAQVLSDLISIVLSDEMSTKYFGTENPIGKQISVVFNDDSETVFTVQAVAEPFPAKSSFVFDALIHYDHQRALDVDQTNWANFTGATFILVYDPAEIETLTGQSDGYRELQNAVSPDWGITRFAFDNLYDLARNSKNVLGSISSGGNTTANIVLGVVALFLLTLSCFNHINLAVATATRRLREIGVRKAVGGSKRQLVIQFLSENILLCQLALLLGFVLAIFLFLPGFNALFDFVGGGVSFSAVESRMFWLFLLCLLILTGIIAGAYPAFYVASFQPTVIFQGRQRIRGSSVATLSFLTFQFVLAFLTMILGVVVAHNANFQANKSWGYTTDHILVLRFENNRQFQLVRDELDGLPDVHSAVGSGDHIGRSWSRTVVDFSGEKMEALNFGVGYGYIELLDMTLRSGRSLDEKFGSSDVRDVVINEQFARSRGWTNVESLDQSFQIDSMTFTVIGVVENFMYSSI